MNAIQSEKEHFDQISEERNRHGFIPDLDRMTNCDYFYLSPFRRKALANLALRGPSGFMIEKLRSKLPAGANVLDLGCGSGWFSLELAKAGFKITSVDLSESSIALARKTLGEANLRSGGSVTYHCADLNTWSPDTADFDAVCYMGSLHHLDSPKSVVTRIKAALKPGHFMTADEPLSHNYRKIEAAFAALVRTMLSACGAWYESIPLPQSKDEVNQLLTEVANEYENWADKKEGQQSPMNNSTHGGDNLALLEEHYEILADHNVLGLQHRLIGGIRLESEEANVKAARFLTYLEEILLSEGFLKPVSRAVFGRAR